MSMSVTILAHPNNVYKLFSFAEISRVNMTDNDQGDSAGKYTFGGGGGSGGKRLWPTILKGIELVRMNCFKFLGSSELVD